MTPMTPMMQQYLELKEKNKDCILFFRLGDFYEMFFEDAELASRELDLVLTGRDYGKKERAPMCGVPHHSSEAYIARLIAKGYKVAVCEQLEDASAAKGLVKRDVVKIITPGTVTEGELLEDSRNNFLAAVYTGEGGIGVAFADISTGELSATEIDDGLPLPKLMSELAKYAPSEVLLCERDGGISELTSFLSDRVGSAVTVENDLFSERAVAEAISLRFGNEYAIESGLFKFPLAMTATGAVLGYLSENRKASPGNIGKIEIYSVSSFMQLDLAARRNLELTETMRSGEKRGSLLWVLDRTKTAQGARLLRKWVEQPLADPSEIIRRLDAVNEILSNYSYRVDLGEALRSVSDIERIMTKMVYGSANCRDIKALSFTLSKVPDIQNILGGSESRYIKALLASLADLSDLTDLIDRAIIDDPPLSLKEGGFIKDGYSAELDEYRDIVAGGKGYLASLEAGEREKTGIKNLKISYNKVFGYYVEVTRSYLHLVPENYIRKQTLANCERYITEELKELEGRILTAGERINSIEYEIFTGIRQQAAARIREVQETAATLSALDVLRSLAEAAFSNKYVRPDIVTGDQVSIKEGRHPVVEQMLTNSLFVPNDANLDCGENRLSIITGPNMSGKSTYMRQTALIVLMAQIGSFVPAESARIGIVDKIFSRVGAADDLAAGQSTFMVEMTEVADILRNATKKSLIIFDEIGRGTSTYDGMAIARAVIEYAASPKLGAKTLFATHYHELTELEGMVPGVKNYNISVKKRGDSIIFLQKIVRGPADGSYGIEVAKLAGVPDVVIKRAKEELSVLESLASGKMHLSEPVDLDDGGGEANVQLGFSERLSFEIVDELKIIEIDTLTPIECMNILYEVVNKAKKL